MEFIVREGRPEDFRIRSIKEQHIYEFLDDLGINYMYLDHQEEFSMGDAADADEAIGVVGAKNVFLHDKNTVLGLTPGAVTPFGLLNDKNGLVQLIIDETLRDEELFAMHPCVNTTTVRMSNRDFMEKVIPAMGHDPVFTEI